MKHFALLILLTLSIVPLQAQSDSNLKGEVRKIPREQLITPYAIEVTFDKTVHVLFPSKVIYIDLGSNHIIAGKADGAENVIRIKAATEDFIGETNFSVICDDGNFYSFNARYANEPSMLNIDMSSLTKNYHQIASNKNIAHTSSTVYLTELGKESPGVVNLIMETIYNENKRLLRHLGSKQQKIQFTVQGMYVHHGMFYFHTMIQNKSQVPFDIDYIKFKVVDTQSTKRGPVQEIALNPVRTYHDPVQIKGKSKARTVYALPKFTLPKNQIVVVELIEKDGGRHQTIQIEHTDITSAKTIDTFKIN